MERRLLSVPGLTLVSQKTSEFLIAMSRHNQIFRYKAREEIGGHGQPAWLLACFAVVFGGGRKGSSHIGMNQMKKWRRHFLPFLLCSSRALCVLLASFAVPYALVGIFISPRVARGEVVPPHLAHRESY